MYNKIAIETLEDLIQQLESKMSMSRKTYMNYIEVSKGWNDYKQTISNKHWSYQEKLETKIDSLKEALHTVKEMVSIELQREKVEAEKEYLKWLSDKEELPF